MKLQIWREGMTPEQERDTAYWSLHVLALKYADGWYYDDVEREEMSHLTGLMVKTWGPRYANLRRVMTGDNGRWTFHIPDLFDVGNLPQVEKNWDGHTTEEKWTRILMERGIEAT